MQKKFTLKQYVVKSKGSALILMVLQWWSCILKKKKKNIFKYHLSEFKVGL